MPRAARRPAPMARMTVAAPVEMSPPAKTPGNGRHAGLLIHLDVAPLVDLQPRRGLGDDRVGAGAQRVDHGIHVDSEIRARQRHGAPAPGGVRLAQLHLLAAHPGDPAGGVAEDLHRGGQPLELHALLDGVLQFLGARRGFAPRPPVDDGDLFGAHAQGDAAGVHGGVAGADDGHALAHAHRRVVERLPVAAHQVHAGEKLVGGEDAVVGLAGDAHEFRRARAGADEDGVVAHLAHELRDGEQLADDACRAGSPRPACAELSISWSMTISGRRNSGMPYFSTPPATCRASKTVTLTPARARSPAQARPAGPEPMMAARLHGGAGQRRRASRPSRAPWRNRPRSAPGGRWPRAGACRPPRRSPRTASPAGRRGRTPRAGRWTLSESVGLADIAARQRGDEAGDVDAHRAARHAARLLAAQAAVGLGERAFAASSPSATSSKLCARTSGACCGMATRCGGMVRMFLGSSHLRRFRHGPRELPRSRRRCFTAGGFGRSGRPASRPRRGSGPAPAFSSRSKRFWRSMSSSKFTRWPSKSAPSTQANFISPPTVTRQEPHMPVPSTMIEFRLTTVGTPKGRVTSAQAFIMGMGPMATTSRRPAVLPLEHVGQRRRDEPLAAVAAVVGGDDQLVAVGAELVLPEHLVARAEPDDRDGAVAQSPCRRAAAGRPAPRPGRRPPAPPCRRAA